MRRIREIIVGFLVISMVLGSWIIPPTTAEAAKKETEVTKAMIKEAKTAYAKFLKENKGIKKFTVLDVIGDDMPELITVGKESISVYTYGMQYCSQEKEVAYATYDYCDCIYYHPTKKYVVFQSTNQIKATDPKYACDKQLFIERYIEFLPAAWYDKKPSKNVADIEYTIFDSSDGDRLYMEELIAFQGTIRATGAPISGYGDQTNEYSISKSDYEKRHKKMMKGTKKITKFIVNSSANRKKYL